MRSSMILLAGAVAVTACDKPKPHPEAATSLPPPPSARASSAAVASSASAPAAPQVSPPDPGRVDLVFTGDFAKQVSGEGAVCDDGFWLRSRDVLGPDAAPRWVLVLTSGEVQLQVGPFESSRVFDSPKGASAGVERVANGFRLDVDLLDNKGGKGKVHVKGTVSCAKPPAGKVPETIVRLLGEESGSAVRDHCTQDFGRAQTTACVSVVVAGKPEEKARDLVLRLRKKLPPGWVAFVGTSRWLGDEKHEGAVEVVVGPGRDQLDILRLAQSNAINYEMETEALVKKLRAYHAVVPIDIWHAETDTIELDLTSPPPDLKAFAKDVYAFCPDIVDQGVGTVAALEREIAKSRRLYLWWD
jgi:hypothetical protein